MRRLLKALKPSGGHEKVSFRQALKEEWRWIVGISIFVLVIEWLGWLEPLNMAVLDAAFQGKSTAIASDIRIVPITEEDYRDIFHSQSPLDPALVLCMIKQLRESIDASGVIGVDLDTSDPQWSQKIPVRDPKLIPAACKAPGAVRESLLRHTKPQIIWSAMPALPIIRMEAEPPIIWAAVPRTNTGRAEGKQQSDALRATLGKLWTGLRRDVLRLFNKTDESKRLPLDCVVGGRLSYPGDASSMGVPLFESHLGAVREYAGQFDVRGDACPQSSDEQSPGEHSGTMLSLSRAIVHTLEPDRVSDEKAIFNYADTRPLSLNAMDFFKEHDKSRGLTATQRNFLRQYKVVLIGGKYAAARDQYQTPVGSMAGVELVAQAIENDLNGAIHEATLPRAIGADLLAGFLIFCIYYLWPPRIAFWTSTGIILVGSVVVTWWLFRWTAIWLSFVPVATGMLLHEMYTLQEKAVHASELQERAAYLETELTALDNRLQDADVRQRDLEEKLCRKEEEAEKLAKRVQELEQSRTHKHHGK